MAYQEEEQAKLKRQHTKQAIALAMNGQWREAAAINNEIITHYPNDVDACNRLGRAHMELGEYSQSREAYQRAIEIDPYNSIASRNLRRLEYLSKGLPVQGSTGRIELHHFIEEVGKAGVVNLCRLAPLEVRVKMAAGDKVYPKINKSRLIIDNVRGEFLGQVESKHANRLIKLMQGGNKYSAAITSTTDDRLTIIIKEVYQDPSQFGRASFPPKGTEKVKEYAGDRLIKRQIEEYEEVTDEEPDYTIINRNDKESGDRNPHNHDRNTTDIT